MEGRQRAEDDRSALKGLEGGRAGDWAEVGVGVGGSGLAALEWGNAIGGKSESEWRFGWVRNWYGLTAGLVRMGWRWGATQAGCGGARCDPESGRVWCEHVCVV